ncbi:hypothetical protein [Streptomyces anulatus]|uniref:hypothetical protein n=1 Tax=Streptomyces anulatus TaxID=1892 RepID=UPI003625B3ED
MIGHAEGEPAVHDAEMNVLVGWELPARGAEQAERATRIRDIVLGFATAERSRLWPATDKPTAKTVGDSPFEGQQTLDLWEGIGRP